MATLLPNGKQQFIDSNGTPLAGGSVYFYVPGTTTAKTTWQDSGQVTQNTNPVVLDAAGEAIIYGAGQYRQVVFDAAGNTIWDQLTADTAVGGLAWGGTSTGSANAQVIAASSFSQQDGQQIAFIAGFANTGAMTITVGSGTPIPVLKDSTTGPTPLIGGEIGAGNAVNLIYDAARGAFHIENTSINGSAPASNAQALAATSTAVYLTPANLALERTLFGLGIPMLNGVLTSSVAANAVTFSLKGLDGNTPASTEPVYIAFRNASATNGNYVVRTISSATSITVASGATLGTSNSTPFRIWIVAVDTGAGVQLGVVNALSGLSIMPLRDNIIVNTSGTPANSAQVIYTTSSQSGVPMRILGYFDWGSGLVTAGTWASDATYKQLWGPGIPKPGEVAQVVYSSTSTSTTATGTTKLATALTGSITPNSAANLVKVIANGSVAAATTTTGAQSVVTLWRGTGTTQIGNSSLMGITGATGSSINAASPVSLLALDAPQSASSVQYGVYIADAPGGSTIHATFLGTAGGVYAASSGTMLIEEIMA